MTDSSTPHLASRWLCALPAALALAATLHAQTPAPQVAASRPQSAPRQGGQKAPAAAAPEQRRADFIVAVVNTEPITNNEVSTRMERGKRQARERGMALPSDAALRKQVLEHLIAEKAQLQYAREIGLDADDAALEQAELSIARQNGLPSARALHDALRAEGIAVSDFREDVRRQVLLARLREQEIDPRVRITDADVDAYIRAQTGIGASEPQINLAMILVAVPEGAPPEELARLQARAQDVARRAQAGEDFADLAKTYSDATNRGADGGVLGLREADRYPELFVQSTRGARVGSVVGPVRSPAGFHVLKVLERKQSADLPEVRIAQTRARHILLKIGPSQSERVARERLADFKRRIEAGRATFAELARQHSEDASAEEGGDLGWNYPGQFAPEFEQAMDNLDEGQISEPLTSRFGVHLIQVQGRREKALSADEQRQLARNVLRERKTEEAFATWSQEVRARAYVEYREPPR
ncbi:MAG: peptidylprolyl isomerase [Burkholderiaceae bacterium]|jgi:peptidyl-prolyl cis-trans isomerase SurA|nr:peptidylprolyl isomerase [Burkholderiaceae bacterium]